MDIPRIFNITESAHRIHNPFTPEKFAALGAALRLEPGTSLLDLGSGSGEMLCSWARDHRITGTGIDMSRLFTAQAKRRALALGVSDQLRFVHGDAAGYVSEGKVGVAACVGATWFLIRRMNLGRQLYAFGDNPEGARRAGVNLAVMQALAFGWCGLMAGIAALMQVNIVQEVVPNALYGRELDVLAAVVLGGARLGGGKGTITGCILGVMFVAITQNGLNLLGISPFAFQMIIGAAILIAISTSNIDFGKVRAFAGERK